jgi:Ca2+-dependent lipid-binding protein
VDILPEAARATIPDVYIEPEPEQELEVRVCVYNTTDVKMMDIEGTSDVYFECYIDNKKKKLKTDVHYRCMDGNADFSYRLKLFYKNTKKSERQLEVRCFDRDLIGKNDFIGSNTIDLWEPIQDCLLTKKPASVTKKYYKDHLK